MATLSTTGPGWPSTMVRASSPMRPLWAGTWLTSVCPARGPVRIVAWYVQGTSMVDNTRSGPIV
jgi:hypothetical protein